MIRWQRAILAGLVGTVVFDMIGVLLNGRWTTPAMLAAKLGVPFVGGVVAHYTNGVLLAIIFAGVGPSLWGPRWARALTYMSIEQVFGVWLFLNPLLGMGIAGLKAGAMAPVISLVKHLAFGLVIAYIYPAVTAVATAREERRPAPRFIQTPRVTQ